MKVKALLAAALLSIGTPILAQTDPGTQILLLAPQLQTFAGSSANLQALALGLTQGTTITIATTGPDGITQIATFTPPSALSITDAARALETARQSLISRAIAAPTAEQVAITLMGGNLPTALGPVAVRGVLTGTVSTTAVAVQRTFTATTTFAGSTANLDALTTGLTTGRAITLTSPAGQTVTFIVPGGAMSVAEAMQALSLAQQLLALQGILNPTPDQIRAALMGGTVLGANGPVQLAGVLQGRALATSASAPLNTSTTLLPQPTSTTPPSMLGTSNSPGTAATTAPTTTAPAAAGLITPPAAGTTPRLGAR